MCIIVLEYWAPPPPRVIGIFDKLFLNELQFKTVYKVAHPDHINSGMQTGRGEGVRLFFLIWGEGVGPVLMQAPVKHTYNVARTMIHCGYHRTNSNLVI